jgi:hypothetical protein
MFQIVELIQAGEDETSRRILPLQFPTRAAAIEHVELLQLQFFTASAAAASIVWAALDYTEIRPVTKYELLAVQRLAQDATRLPLSGAL